MIGKVITELNPEHKWATQLRPWAKGTHEFTAAPGLTVIVGENGVGKSTLLKALEFATFVQGNEQDFTTPLNARIRNHPGVLVTEIEWPHSRVLKFDAVRDTDRNISDLDAIFASLGGFDGWAATKTASAGETVALMLMTLLAKLAPLPVTMPKPSSKLGDVNPRWQERIQAYLDIAEGKPQPDETSKITLLMDEPDRSMSLLKQLSIWGILHRMSQKYQIIATAHTLPAVCRADHVVELTPGFAEAIRATARTCLGIEPTER